MSSFEIVKCPKCDELSDIEFADGPQLPGYAFRYSADRYGVCPSCQRPLCIMEWTFAEGAEVKVVAGESFSEEPCEGCSTVVPCDDLRPYRVTHHDGSTAIATYCDACADLARVDWNGETAAIEAA